jgi:hypothetical protein
LVAANAGKGVPINRMPRRSIRLIAMLPSLEQGRSPHDLKCSLPNDSRKTLVSYMLADGARQKLAYIYFEEEPGRRTAAKLLTKDEARKIAVFI